MKQTCFSVARENLPRIISAIYRLRLFGVSLCTGFPPRSRPREYRALPRCPRLSRCSRLWSRPARSLRLRAKRANRFTRLRDLFANLRRTLRWAKCTFAVRANLFHCQLVICRPQGPPCGGHCVLLRYGQACSIVNPFTPPSARTRASAPFTTKISAHSLRIL